MLCLWAQTLQKALEVVEVLCLPVSKIWTSIEVEVEVEAALQYLVSKFRLFDEMGVEVGVEAKVEVHGPLWEPLSAKVHVGFRDRTVGRSSNC